MASYLSALNLSVFSRQCEIGFSPLLPPPSPSKDCMRTHTNTLSPAPHLSSLPPPSEDCMREYIILGSQTLDCGVS